MLLVFEIGRIVLELEQLFHLVLVDFLCALEHNSSENFVSQSTFVLGWVNFDESFNPGLIDIIETASES